MDLRDHHDCICIVSEARDIIVEAKLCGLPTGGFSKEMCAKITGFQNIGVLNDRHLEPKFQMVFDKVLDGRPPEELTHDDFQHMVALHTE